MRRAQILDLSEACQVAGRELEKEEQVGTYKRHPQTCSRQSSRPSSSLTLFRNSTLSVRQRSQAEKARSQEKIKESPHVKLLHQLKSEKPLVRTEAMKNISAILLEVQEAMKEGFTQSEETKMESSTLMGRDKRRAEFAVSLTEDMIADGLLDISFHVLRHFDSKFEIRYYIDKMIFYISGISKYNREYLSRLGMIRFYIRLIENYSKSATREKESSISTICMSLSSLIAGDKDSQLLFNSLGGLDILCSLLTKLGKYRPWDELVPVTHLLAQVLRDNPGSIRYFMDVISTTKVCAYRTNDLLSYPSDNIISKLIGIIPGNSLSVDPSILSDYSFLATYQNIQQQPLYVTKMSYSLEGIGAPYVFMGVTEYPEIIAKMYLSEFVLRLFISSLELEVDETYLKGMFTSNMIQNGVCFLKAQKFYKAFNVHVSKCMRKYSLRL